MRYVLAPFKYVFGKFWIWAGGGSYSGGFSNRGKGLPEFDCSPYMTHMVVWLKLLVPKRGTLYKDPYHYLNHGAGTRAIAI